MVKKLNLRILSVFFVLFCLTPLQVSHADYDSFTVNVPNSQGGYTAIVITKSGNGYTGQKGEYYSQFPSVSQLQAVYRTGTSYTTVVTPVQSVGVPSSTAQVRENIWGHLAGWVAFISLVVLCVLIAGIVGQCPACKKLWARRIVHKEEIDRSNGLKEVTRYRDHRDSSGRLIKRESWRETVPTIDIKYREYCRCNKCFYEWTEISTTSM